MPKIISIRKRLLSVLFWSIISAAFIGPGTVTTASKAGAGFNMQLLWALVFSIFATILLQEAAARITIASGKNLGEIIALKFAGNANSQGLKILLFLAVAFGCAAYQTGNMLGALSGIAIFSDIPQWILTIAIAAVCGALLWIGNFKTIANLLGLIVALMGIAFIYVALKSDVGELSLASSVIPSIPANSSLLIIGLIGTTIVPYNLFLASGISKGQSIAEMRWGLSIAILIGGIISIAIMVVGTQMEGAFSFHSLAMTMAAKIGSWAAVFFGFALFAAGMSSAITAPLAAAITAKSLFASQQNQWQTSSKNFRLVWGFILGVGLLFGLLQVKPIPAIIMAQAINGILLPLVTIFLILAVNDKQLIPKKYTNSLLSNVLMLFIVGLSCFLGLNNIWKAVENVLIPGKQWENVVMVINAILTGLILIGLGVYIFGPKSKERSTIT